MRTDEFINYCIEEITCVYNKSKNGRPDDRHKYRTEGLFMAAEKLNLISRVELQEIIEQQHYAVFGETVNERKTKKSQLNDLKISSPDEYFDIPAIERKGS